MKVTRTSDGKTDYPIYTMGGQLLTDDDQRANTRSDYVSLNGSLVAKRTATLGKTNWTTTYEHTDALHSPTEETNATGSLTRAEHYTPYGEPGDHQYVQGPGYTGHVTDAATGLTYAQQRYYDPVMGRFLSVDPVLADSNTGAHWNRYAYAAGNPYKFVDPDGRCEKSVGTSICGNQAVGTETAAGTADAKVLMTADGKNPASTKIANVRTGNNALSGARDKVANSYNADATRAWDATSWRYDPTNPELTRVITHADGSKGFTGALHDPGERSVIRVGSHMFDFANQVQRSYFNASFMGGSTAMIFIVLHEIGHVWDQQTNPDFDSESHVQEEIRANSFAAGFFTRHQQKEFNLTVESTCANCQP